MAVNSAAHVYDERIQDCDVADTSTPIAHGSVASGQQGSTATPESRVRYRVLLAVTFLILCAEWIGVLKVLRDHDVILSGDEPHYLVGALSIGRFRTLNMNPGYNFAVEHHIIFPWTAKPGPHLAASIGQTHLSHNLYFLTHAVGLSALLALPMLSGTRAAELTLVAMLAALAVGLVHLVGQLSGIRSPWRLSIAGLFLTPAIALAATQVYPDLISGLVVAIIILIVAGIEVHQKPAGCQLVVAAVFLMALPWLDQKNVLLTLPLLAAFAVVSARGKLPRLQLGLVVLPVFVSLVGLLALNLYSFSHLLGDPQPISLASVDTLTRSVALLFDRRQGLFVQLPVAVLGVAGLWASRRRLPVAVTASVVLILLTIYGNATQEISFGGGSFVGRFQWPTLPLLLAFAGFYLLELWQLRRKAVGVLVLIIGVLSAVEFVPIVRNEHILYNQIAWDPITYTGWWGGLDPSPVLGYIGGVTLRDIVLPAKWWPGIAASIGRTDPWANWRVLWGLLCLMLVVATAVYLAIRLLRRPWHVRIPVVVGAVSGIVVTLAMTLSTTVLLPSPAIFTAASLPTESGSLHGTSVVVTGAGKTGAVVQGPYWKLLPGRYSATIYYHLTDPGRGQASGAVLLVARPPVAGVVSLVRSPPLAGQGGWHAPFSIHKAGEVVIRAAWKGPGSMQVKSFVLKKLDSSPG
jgi:hypothetical protein